MNLVKWDPFRELEDVTDRLNRIFGRSSSLHAGTAPGMLAMADWSPSVDISETDSEYLIKGEIPGVKKEDIKVTIENGMLTLQGERKMEKEEKGKKFHRVECSYGSFMRSFRMPDDADMDKVKAEFKDGIISIAMPKTAKPTAAKTVDIAVT